MKGEQRTPGDFFDANWEARARAALASAGHDPDLGVSAARDALRVVAGELTEEEFHQRYHGAYLSAFGSDDRPVRASRADLRTGKGEELRQDRVDGKVPLRVSRRTILSLAGAGTAALFLGTMLRSQARGADTPGVSDGSPEVATGDDGDGESARFGWVIDLERCNGCLSCVNGCHQENGLSDGVFWIYVLPFVDENHVDTNFLVRPCQHCSNAPCVKVCPVAARHVRASDGLVLTDYDTCIGCRYCEVACPYGVNYFQWADPSSYGGSFKGERHDARGRAVVGDPPRGVMGKCNLCPQRQDESARRGPTACVLACPQNALHTGDLNDPMSEPMQYLARRRQEDPSLSTFRLLDDLGTEPNAIYIGQEPSERARQVDGPIHYEDWGFVENRRAVLDGPDSWFSKIVKGS